VTTPAMRATAAACPICGNANGNRPFEALEMMFGTRDSFAYSECARCGCLSINEIPPNLDAYYPDNYYSFERSRLSRWVRRYSVPYRAAHLALRRSLPRAPAWLPPTRDLRYSPILDVGSGVGNLLLQLKTLGFTDLLGIDPFIDAAIHYKGGPTILKETLDRITGSFELVILNHSFEHLANPMATLHQVRRVMARDGYVVIRTPLAASFAWRAYGTDWVQLDAPRHLFVHTVESIRILAAQAGLAIDAVQYDSTAFQFWGSEQYRRGIALRDKRSYAQSQRHSIFSRSQIQQYERQAAALNRSSDGDQASIRLRTTERTTN
jgi:SAM-dependent methyltransferase